MKMKFNNGVSILVLLVWSCCTTVAFEVQSCTRWNQSNIMISSFHNNNIPSCIIRSRGRSRICSGRGSQMLPDLVSSVDSSSCSTIMTAVEVFDGSSIVDPVVVSNVFYTSFVSKLLSLLLGQFLAGIVFSFLASLAATQLPKIGQMVATNIFKQQQQPLSTNKNDTNYYDNNNEPIHRNEITPSEYKQPLKDNSKSTITPDVGKLLLCIIIDVIGTSSELIPFVGEFTDIAWAPIAALALRQLYGSNVVFALEFAEEFLPFTDIIPLATICWVIETFYSDTDIAKGLQIGQFQTGTIIDVDSPSNRKYNK